MSIDQYEKSSNRFFAALLLTMPLVVGSTGMATANEPGMFLCGSPSFSGDLWRGLMQIQETGVQVDRKIASEFAKKLGCPFFASATLRPVQFVPNELLLTDGSNTGWANVNYYITYANRDFPPK